MDVIGKLQKLSPLGGLVGSNEGDEEKKKGKTLFGYSEEPRVNIAHLLHRRCMKPDCGAGGEVGRFFLRNCGHVFCISCLLEYLEFEIKEMNKARIGCPHERCKRRIHENDVRALLDPENPGLDDYLPNFYRRILLHEHDKHVIEYSSRDQVKQCPRCLNYYMKKVGCNYTRCPNLYCNTWFCFSCGGPAASWQHFTKGDCLVSADDLYTLIYIPRLLLFTDSVGLICMLPSVLILVYLLIPIFVFFGFPYFAVKEIHHIATRNGRRDVPKIFLYFIYLLLAPFLFMISLPMAIGACLTGVPIVFSYLALAIVKCIPPISKAFEFVDMFFMLTGFLGLTDWKKIVQDTRDARKQMEVAKEQEKEEESEKMSPESMNEYEKAVKDVEKKASKERKDRAFGLKAVEDVPLPGMMLMKKFRKK